MRFCTKSINLASQMQSNAKVAGGTVDLTTGLRAGLAESIEYRRPPNGDISASVGCQSSSSQLQAVRRLCFYSGVSQIDGDSVSQSRSSAESPLASRGR